MVSAHTHVLIDRVANRTLAFARRIPALFLFTAAFVRRTAFPFRIFPWFVAINPRLSSLRFSSSR
jgi:hypothetical protein